MSEGGWEVLEKRMEDEEKKKKKNEEEGWKRKILGWSVREISSQLGGSGGFEVVVKG